MNWLPIKAPAPYRRIPADAAGRDGPAQRDPDPTLVSGICKHPAGRQHGGNIVRHGALLDKGERHPKRQAGAIACCITYRQCLAAACHAKVGKIRSLPEAGRRKAADADGEKRQVESWNASAKRRALQR